MMYEAVLQRTAHGCASARCRVCVVTYEYYKINAYAYEYALKFATDYQTAPKLYEPCVIRLENNE